MEDIYSVTCSGAYGLMHFGAWMKGVCPHIGTSAENAGVGMDDLRSNLLQYLEFYGREDTLDSQMGVVTEYFANGGRSIALSDGEILGEVFSKPESE